MKLENSYNTEIFILEMKPEVMKAKVAGDKINANLINYRRLADSYMQKN
jgi:hypothetical protein